MLWKLIIQKLTLSAVTITRIGLVWVVIPPALGSQVKPSNQRIKVHEEVSEYFIVRDHQCVAAKLGYEPFWVVSSGGRLNVVFIQFMNHEDQSIDYICRGTM